MQVASMYFKERAHAKLHDAQLQASLRKFQGKFVPARRASLVELDDFEATRDAGAAIRQRALDDLDVWLTIFDENARAHIQATQIGKLKPLTAAELDLLTARSNRSDHVGKLWNYYVEAGLEEGIIPADWSGLLK